VKSAKIVDDEIQIDIDEDSPEFVDDKKKKKE